MSCQLVLHLRRRRRCQGLGQWRALSECFNRFQRCSGRCRISRYVLSLGSLGCRRWIWPWIPRPPPPHLGSVSIVKELMRFRGERDGGREKEEERERDRERERERERERTTNPSHKITNKSLIYSYSTSLFMVGEKRIWRKKKMKKKKEKERAELKMRRQK